VACIDPAATTAANSAASIIGLLAETHDTAALSGFSG
jgi:hypothetical protein